MKNLIISLTIALFVSCFAYGQLTEKPLGTTTAANGYIEYLPSSYTTNPNHRLPIILFFHGSGENGNGTTDLYKIYNTGLPQIIKNNSWTYKDQFVVLMPQHTSTSQYNLCPSATEIKNFINFARKAYNIDTLQVFITGLSCGGNGVWDYIGAYPTNEKVAAAVPISANGTKASRTAGCNKTLPTWAFHGTSDTTSPWANDTIANHLFNACPEPHAEAKLTLYPGVAHDAWTQTYNLSSGNDIYAWLLQQKSPSNIPNNILTIKDNEKQTSIDAYPNPFNDQLTVMVKTAQSEPMHLSIIDMIGKKVYTSDQYSTNQEITVGKELPDGLLLIQAQFANQVRTCKVVKLKEQKQNN